MLRAPRSLRRNFSWTLIGSVTYNLVQWVLVVFLARLGDKEMVGQFAYAQALAAPVFLTVGLNLRVVRATDVAGRWTPRQYSTLRVLLNAGSVVVTLVLALATGLSGVALAVVAAICLGKSTEATSQLLYGYFQFSDRLDLVARSMLLRAASGAVLFLVALVAVGGVVAACVGLAAGWTLVYLVHDRPHERRLLREEGRDPVRQRGGGTLVSLARTAVPLGVDAGVGSIASNTPRYAVQHQLGTAALGGYAALAYLGQVVAMVTGALADSLIGRLAKIAHRGDSRAFVRSLGLLVLFGFGVSVVAVLGAWALGGPLVRLLLGPEYVDQSVLVLLMVGAGLITLQRCLGRGLQAGRRFGQVLFVDAITMVATIVAAVVLVPRHGADGAAAVQGIGFGCGAVVAALMLVDLVRTMGPDAARHRRGEPDRVLPSRHRRRRQRLRR